MNKVHTLAMATALILTASCKKSEDRIPRQMNNVAWFLGKWEHKTPQGDLSENWIKVNDSVFNGESFFIKEKDTLFAETMVLSEKGGTVLYTATAKGQNDDLPVAFKLASSTANQVVFENPAHDFPNRITYKRINADSIVASISGVQSGKAASETYPMGRKK